MEKRHQILLPGTNQQLNFFLDGRNIKGARLLVLGAASEVIAKMLADKTLETVELIVEDYDSLMNAKLNLEGEEEVRIRLMDFEFTDFNKEEFDYIYAQGSISDSRRNTILKEIKRILKPGGILCAGEIVNLEKEVPSFVKDIYDASDLEPFYVDEVNGWYKQRGFEILSEADLSKTLNDYYFFSNKALKEKLEELETHEKSFYKKLLNRISHESNAYLKLGGDKIIGFKASVMKRI